MTFQKYLIAPYNTGLQNDLEPWLIPEDAFPTLEDAFIFRGRIKKKFGYRLIGDTTVDNPQLLSRLRINVGTTTAGGNLGATVMPGTVGKVGQMFSVGSTIFTVYQANGATLANGTGTATYNTATLSLTITGSVPNTSVYFYPSEPVMGLITRENSSINVEQIVAFDTQFAYFRSGGAWERLDTATSWTGDDTNFFWGTNYRSTAASATNLYVTNFNFDIGGATADPIRYLPSGTATFTNLRPQLDNGGAPTRYLETSLIILPFKDRLVCFNTVESSAGVFSQYGNRCRFSQNGDPTDTTNGWVDNVPGRGGFIDAPTKEVVVSAEFIKDKLIVYFERSTWELVYTANQILPFRWQKINTELGAESTFSKIPFDKVVLSVGNRGILSCSGVDIQRIDQKIPDLVFNFHNGNDGPKRVYGIRDYYSEVVYWSFPYAPQNSTYPNRVLTYNYYNNSWAIYKESFTCFGYFQYTDDTTWASLEYPTWESWNNPWNSASLQSDFESIIAGNQQGFTFVLDRDKTDNDEMLQITNISSTTITSENHNLETGDYVQVLRAGGVTNLNNSIYYVTRQTDDSFTISDAATGTYTGGGTLKRVSNPNVYTKRFNPFIPQGIGFNCPYVDFFVGRTDEGQFSVDIFLNEADFSVRSNPNAIPGTNIVSTAPYALVNSEFYQNKLWHRLYLYLTSFNMQLRFYMSYDQITNPSIAFSDFVIHAMLLYASPAEKVVG